MKKLFGNVRLWQGISAVLFIFVVLVFASKGCITGFSVLSPEQAAQKEVNFLNTYLLKDVNASVISVNETSGIYLTKISIQDREFNTYITKDGRFIFINAIDTSNVPEELKPKKFDAPDSEKPDVKLFVMSFCPYGNQAEDNIVSAIKLLENKISFEPHYVIYRNYPRPDLYDKFCIENGTYCSMHGIQELHEDVRELCVWKYQNDKFWDFVLKINQKCDATNVDSCWESVADEVGINKEKIKECQNTEMISLLQNEVALNRQYNVRGSPTLIINGEVYNGERTPNAYKDAICSAFSEKPEECSQNLGSSNSGVTGSCS